MHAYEWQKKRECRGYLALADGRVFRGYSVGAEVDRLGEAVFNTGMTGYQEILSDPSYAGQFVCLTAPEIGNVGVNAEDMESRTFFASGLLIHKMNSPSNWRSEMPLTEALFLRDAPALAGLDTRALTRHLRDHGAQKSFLCASGAVPEEEGIKKARDWEGLDGQDYASRVSSADAYDWDSDGTLTTGYPFREETLPAAEYRVIAYDFGIKWNILRNLRRCGMQVRVVPARTSAEEVLAARPDGVFLSNGPADPAAVNYAAKAIGALLGKVPLMGICLGHQLLGLALGGKTYKLPFGHHGCNHPVKDLKRDRTLITSQNHNYAVAAESLPDTRAEITHLSLNDNSVEGLRCRYAPAFSVQFHPEAAPGPFDALGLFAEFRQLMAEA